MKRPRKPRITIKKVLKNYVTLEQKHWNKNERLMHMCVQAVRKAQDDNVSPKERAIKAAGQVLFRERTAAEVLCAHILSREGWPDTDGAYSRPLPWAKGSVSLNSVMPVTHVHACFKVTDPLDVLSADPVSIAVKKLLATMQTNKVTRHDQIVGAIVATVVAHTGFVEHMRSCVRKGVGLADCIRDWDKKRWEAGGEAFVPPGVVHRNRFHSGLNAEQVFALLVRLDRMEDYSAESVEKAVASPLMLPHVWQALQQFSLVDPSEPTDVKSSTNVRLMHEVFRALDAKTPRSRKAWLVEVHAATRELVREKKAKARGRLQALLHAVEEQLTPSVCAWNFCKVGCVVHTALGGSTHLRLNREHPVQLRANLRKCGGRRS